MKINVICTVVDCCRVWESHIDVAISREQTDTLRVWSVRWRKKTQSPVESPETELLEDIIRKLLPTASQPPLEAAPIPLDQDLIIQRLMGAIFPSQPVAQERSKLTDLETMLLNWLPVGTVTEEDAASPTFVVGFCRGVFFMRGFDPYDGLMSDSRQVVSVLAYGMAGGPHRRPVHSGTGASSGAPEPADGKRRLIRGEGLVARISDHYEPQLPVVGEDIPGPAAPCHVGTARLLATVDRRTRTVGRAVRRPYSDLDDSDNDVLYVEGHDSAVRQVNL